ncbi:iron complex outermembrane receptor protein [Novosphingobium kunmingense]|uniref:Iron complex outermembrane receptor protein n=1 Tax=Novosphingobium kunmingense TaxID=1211806 RepID=A0A2N0I314_9SPHN|nr:TonB-dependent receptor [Novosphingobium kunmingense]PKB25584.1 iron complex outermembrane receptor protein [Novosphingobium kunmingense]
MISPKRLLPLVISASALCFAGPVIAQEVQTPPEGGSGQVDHNSPNDSYHSRPEEIVVTAPLRTARIDSLSGVAVLSAQDLTASLRPSIGDTLADVPGVSSTSFGPTASRPVLRGLQGERVRVLTNGIGSIDVSNTSADHAPVVNPLLAERIEVLRGPQSLVYGSSAIGGVVNVVDSRIPNAIPDEPLHLSALAGYATAAKERNASLAANLRLGGGFVAHVDGSYLKADDMRIGGYALTPALRAQALQSSLLPPEDGSDIDFVRNANLRGVLPNTAARTWSAAAGFAYINDGGSLGLAYSHFDSLYGVPVRLATLSGQGEESPRLQQKQDRIDARAEVRPYAGPFEQIAFRFGYADYTHAELEPDGAIGTTFYNKGMEGRLELRQAKSGGWSGISGLQFVRRAFDVEGDEAFLPRNDTGQFGLFTMQSIDTGPLRLETGGRWEHSVLTATPRSDQPQFLSGKRTFDALSGALGASYELAPEWRLGVNLSRTERAPAAEELFANGPHAGTSAFEIGDPDLRKERAWSLEGILRGKGAGYSFELSAYHSWFGNFIFERATGTIEDGLPVFQIGQADARLYGFEAEGTVTLARFGPWTVEADALADYVHATIAGEGPAPRIPPLRVKGGLELSSSHLNLRGEIERVTAQSRTAAFETVTPGYTMVNAEIGWRPWGRDRPLSLVLSANNLFDVDARRHASFAKDYAPLAGRDIRLTARLDL